METKTLKACLESFPNMPTKTIRQFLESLPEPARTQAFNNVWEGANLDEQVESMSEACGRSFDTADGDFDDLREGFKYWYEITTRADHGYQIRLHKARGLDYDWLLTGNELNDSQIEALRNKTISTILTDGSLKSIPNRFLPALQVMVVGFDLSDFDPDCCKIDIDNLEQISIGKLSEQSEKIRNSIFHSAHMSMWNYDAYPNPEIFFLMNASVAPPA